MKNAYDRVLRKRARDAAISIGLDLKEGVYTMMGGPNFETPAELRLMHLQGIDAVGEKFLSLFNVFGTSIALYKQSFLDFYTENTY